MGRPRKRTPLEDGLKLDLNLLRRQGILRSEPAGCSSISWDRRYFGGNAAISGVITWRFSSAKRGLMRLLVGEVKQSVDLVATPRHFGGFQWHFLCPILRQRASVLWLPPGESCFASRQAWGKEFAYASQFETAPFRALSRAHAIRHRLGDHYYIDVFQFPLPRKPRGMHRNTYEEQLKRLLSCEKTVNLYEEEVIAHAPIVAFRNRFRLSLMSSLGGDGSGSPEGV
jgi:hypothetical protein